MFDADELKWLGETPRMATYRSGANGHSAAQIGLAAALIRGRDNTSTARTVAPAKPKASTSKPQDRVQIVAEAVANDPALKGKAGSAINFLADPAYSGVTGQGIVKLLRAGATTEAPTLAITTTSKPTATRKRSDALGGGNQPTAESKASWDRVYDRMFGAKA